MKTVLCFGMPGGAEWLIMFGIVIVLIFLAMRAKPETRTRMLKVYAVIWSIGVLAALFTIILLLEKILGRV